MVIIINSNRANSEGESNGVQVLQSAKKGSVSYGQ